MTDRHKGYVVHLDADLRDNDSEGVISAISMIRGVAEVTPITTDYAADVIIARRRDRMWSRALTELAASLEGAPVPRRDE